LDWLLFKNPFDAGRIAIDGRHRRPFGCIRHIFVNRSSRTAVRRGTMSAGFTLTKAKRPGYIDYGFPRVDSERVGVRTFKEAGIPIELPIYSGMGHGFAIQGSTPLPSPRGPIV
jgi:hypothetical protein